MKNPVILFTTDSLKRRGKERQLSILSKELFEGGFNIKILTKSYTNDNYISEYKLDRIEIKLFKGSSKVSLFKDFTNKIKEVNPSIVISWDNQSAIFSLLLSKIYRYKFINASIRHGIRGLKFSHILRTIFCHLSPYVMANSIAGLKANNLIISKKRFVLYNGIENSFRNTLDEKSIITYRNKLIPGFRNNPGLVYISIANFVPYKDYLTVLNAFKKLKDHYSFHYFIIGDGPMRTIIENKIHEYKLSDKIHLIGTIEKVNQYLFISDIFLHSSNGEGISNSILEAMYSGLPVIATKVGGIPETVFEPYSLLFTVGDEHELFECFLQASELIKKFDYNNEHYQNHLKKFSVESMVNNFVNIINQILLDA